MELIPWLQGHIARVNLASSDRSNHLGLHVRICGIRILPLKGTLRLAPDTIDTLWREKLTLSTLSSSWTCILAEEIHHDFFEFVVAAETPAVVKAHPLLLHSGLQSLEALY